MNDIHEVSETFHAILYADDISLFSLLDSFNEASYGSNLDMQALSMDYNNEHNKTKYMLSYNNQIQTL